MKMEKSIDQYNSLTEEVLAFHHLHRTPFVVSGAEIPPVSHENISFQFLQAKYPNRVVNAEKTLQNNESRKFRLAEYCDYALSAKEVQPFYLHLKLDASYKSIRDLIHLSPLLYNWFDALPDRIRPHFFWILIGPVNSGTKMHQDMMNTSAWNLVIEGVKKWTFVREAKLVNFYQHPGDLVFVPSMCPHSVVNLTPSLALTENLLNVHNMTLVAHYLQSQGMEDWVKVLKLLKEKYDQSRF